MIEQINIIQGTDDWYKIKCGNVGASRIADIMAKTKFGPSASRKNYMSELLVERLTGMMTERYQSKEMLWGIEHEEEARKEYEYLNLVDVEKVGFIFHPEIFGAGASPDGLVEESGLIEIKCPNTATHIECLLNDHIDSKYILQMQFQMACTERDWCDFISYDPRCPEQIRLKIIRVPWDEDKIKEIENEVKLFLSELESQIQSLKNIYQF